MEKAVRRKFTDEFKDGAIKLVTEQGYRISEAARNLSLNATQLRRWVKGKSPGTSPTATCTVQSVTTGKAGGLKDCEPLKAVCSTDSLTTFRWSTI